MRDLVGITNIVFGTCRQVSEEEFLRGAAANRERDLGVQLLL